MVVRSGVVTAWPRPQLPVVQPTEDVTPAPPAAVDQALSPPSEEPIPPFDLATLLPDGGPTDSDGSADSPSAALQALADVVLDEIQPSTDLNGLDLSLTGGTEVEGSAPIIPPVPLPPPDLAQEPQKPPCQRLLLLLTSVCLLLCMSRPRPRSVLFTCPVS